MAGYERGGSLEKVLRCTDNVIYDIRMLTENAWYITGCSYEC